MLSYDTRIQAYKIKRHWYMVAWKDANREYVRRYGRKYRQDHIERIRETNKEASQRYRDNHPERAKENNHRYYWAHLKACKKVRKQYKQTHKEETARWQRMDRAKNPEKYKEWQRRDRASNPEKYRLRGRRWYQNNPEAVKAKKLRHRARKANTVVNLAPNQRREILDGGCFFCDSFDDLALAHDIAISKGGNTTRGNVFCLCRSCNSKMGTKSLADMISQLELI